MKTHSMSASSLPDDLDRELNNINSLRYRYAIVRALHRGQEWQPDQPRWSGLPSGLVLYIFRPCDLPRRDSSPALYLPWLQENMVEGEAGMDATVLSLGNRRDGLWYATPHLSESYLQQIHQFRLHTLSKDGGWFR
ncbi:hypothetical protein FRB95_005711 [Tulasnella sp. JGI-2019a]|nr:hypothetical protein FRB95_005711 [Tulasnella sp. JGI-2019a]